MKTPVTGGTIISGVMEVSERAKEAGPKTARPHAKSLNSGQDTAPNFPPPKTDKPKPHICATCTRPFARLEHLKRHERSHTKEKPFTCNDCTRAFARRDLLLRHQQKLHMTAPPASRGKGSRRESTSSTVPSGSGRVRKNSMASSNTGNSGPGSMRPRANTISHVDNATRGRLAAAGPATSSRQNHLGLGRVEAHGLPGVGGYQFRGMSTAAGYHGNPQVLPKLETRNRTIDVGASLQTAPAYGGFGRDMDMDMDNLWFPPGSTINPAQLHFPDPMQNFAAESPQSLYHRGFPDFPFGQDGLDGDSNVNWMNDFDHQMSFGHPNEEAIDDSSPSVISSGSPEEMSDAMLDGSNIGSNEANMWQHSMMSGNPMAPAYAHDTFASQFPDLYSHPQLSPKSFQGLNGNPDQYLSTSPLLVSAPPLSLFPGMDNQYYHPSTAANSDTPGNSAASISSSNRQSSVTSVSTDSITDATRQALLASLSQPSVHGHGLKTSQPQTASPLSAGSTGKSPGICNVPLPSTHDLQRYVAAYIQYFHPHLPFLHIPSLSFDSPAFNNHVRSSSSPYTLDQSSVVAGGGSLILAMAAIGALYEYDFGPSKDLFEMAKTMIQMYLQERRKEDMSASFMKGQNNCVTTGQSTPLWLVQAMLLNVIYGHNCGDKMAASSASTHGAALVSLARGADLVNPSSPSCPRQEDFHQVMPEDTHMVGDDSIGGYGYGRAKCASVELEDEWHNWKIREERKRTLYAIFILSSLLVSSYNHAPALMNSEIRLSLPCDENLWAADSATTWSSLGGSASVEQNEVLFSTALSSLLTASQRQQQRQQEMLGLGFETIAEQEIRPSTFGCLVLINAIHNYIWETRQRHMGRQWTTQETEAMHGHIEPALRAWQVAWSSNSEHSLQRPNPFGASSLSADCIPLLDLAHVRLFVNLGKAREAFFDRNYDAMAHELARGAEIVEHAEHAPSMDGDARNLSAVSSIAGEIPEEGRVHIKQEHNHLSSNTEYSTGTAQCLEQCSKRERHLRKAAFCAANALTMSDRLNVTFADYNSRELPLQSALCSFDCAQVLAEWLSTVQQRVGRYLGLLGRDYTDFSRPSSCMFLEDEDCALLEKIHGILHNLENKLAESGGMDGITAMVDSVSGDSCYYASKILLVHAQMYDRQSVWPVTREMSQSLRTQAAHITATAEASLPHLHDSI